MYPTPVLIKPKALKTGDTIAIISTSGATPTTQNQLGKDAFDQGIELLEKAGFKTRLMPAAKNQWHYLAGTDQERLNDLHNALTDPSIDAILCARGGYGAMRLLPHLNWPLITRSLQENPKALIGFSDITALHLAFYQRLGLVSFYGPMLTSNLIHQEPYSWEELIKIITGKNQNKTPLNNLTPYQCLSDGVVEAPLTGGNLSLLAALCGTPYQAETKGHLLFLEDWHESFYTLDRKFQQLKMAGLFDQIKGLLLCDFSELTPEPTYELPDLMKELCSDLIRRGIPVGLGFSVGHGEQTGTLPYGICARFNATTGTIALLENPVA